MLGCMFVNSPRTSTGPLECYSVYEMAAGCPLIVIGHQWIGLGSGKNGVLGWMSMDNPRTSIHVGPVDWMGEWDRPCIGLDVHG